MRRVCDKFSECSSYVKRWIDKQSEVKEESLTDWLLFNLSEKLPNVRYKQFSRTEEGRKTGADWEWWFVFSDNESFTARVQAKKLKSSVDNYGGLAYTRNGKLQIERLIEDSELEGYASFYAFYSTESGKKSLCKGKLGLDGVFWAEAHKLKTEFIDSGRKKLQANDILKFATPLSCLFCCPVSGFSKKEFQGYLERYFPSYSTMNKQNIYDNGEPLGFGINHGHLDKHVKVSLQ